MAITTLVVDNNPVLLRAVSALLEQEHCQVKTACNGLEAIEILQEYHPDIVFTDMIMPLVGGDKLCKIIRKSPRLKDIFLVVLSAIIIEDRERILAELDYDLCIAKGSIHELRDHLRKALDMFGNKVRAPNRILGDSKQVTESQNVSVLGELLSEKHHLKDILENLKEGIIELSQQGKIVSLNQAAEKILNCEMEDLIGVPFASLSWSDHTEKVNTWLQNELLEKGGNILEATESAPIILHEKVVSASFLPVREGDNVFAVCILRDITRQFIAEKQKHEFDNAIRLVKKMDAMSCMAGGVAHDFNNLLTVICGNLDMINLTGINCNMDENGILLESAKRAAYFTVDLVRKLSCFSPFGIISREDVVIEDLVTVTVAEFFRGIPGSYVCQVGKDKNVVNVDADQIAAAIQNILRNAIEAGPTGDLRVVVANEVFDSPSIRSGQYIPEGNFVKISIRDNGKGIERENLLKIFDPYYSTKQRGTIKGMGLGLTIVYSTLRNHGGYVVVESEVGMGTEVSLFLPIFRLLTDMEDAVWKGNLPKRQILLVERDEQLRTIGKIMLEYLGYQALTATTKEEILTAVKRRMECRIPLDMAILNLSGPGGSDGVEICRALHDIDPSLKVVVSSGALMEPAMRNYKEYGFVNILPKPYTLDDLKRITSVL
jgi:two-component system, cell cycle sensor histidine kinase and response regulator CckA